MIAVRGSRCMPFQAQIPCVWQGMVLNVFRVALCSRLFTVLGQVTLIFRPHSCSWHGSAWFTVVCVFGVPPCVRGPGVLVMLLSVLRQFTVFCQCTPCSCNRSGCLCVWCSSDARFLGALFVSCSFPCLGNTLCCVDPMNVRVTETHAPWYFVRLAFLPLFVVASFSVFPFLGLGT